MVLATADTRAISNQAARAGFKKPLFRKPCVLPGF
jgi:hypothetical protein